MPHSLCKTIILTLFSPSGGYGSNEFLLAHVPIPDPVEADTVVN